MAVPADGRCGFIGMDDESLDMKHLPHVATQLDSAQHLYHGGEKSRPVAKPSGDCRGRCPGGISLRDC